MIVIDNWSITDGSVFVTDTGEQSRAFNIKDGYALQLAVKCGYNVCAISGSRSKSAIYRLNSLGIQDVYMGTHTKSQRFKVYLEEKAIIEFNKIRGEEDKKASKQESNGDI